MAKSLRSKSKVAARRVKRQDPASVYKINAEQRIQQASARLAALAKRPKVSTTTTTTITLDADDASAPALMDQDGDDEAAAPATGEKAKVSTSGTRGSRRETWRAARGWKARVGSKNNGRTKRRR